MTTRFPPYQSFLLRFWYEPDEQCWHGEIEHVQSRQRAPVTHLDQIPAIVADWSSLAPRFLHTPPGQPAATDQE
ncbi:MAG: hypothetical protein H7Z42_04665 [Roseiflexaceae bacterium]|nr:hypothetical protein [Roseiflexaceae bacterium]